MFLLLYISSTSKKFGCQAQIPVHFSTDSSTKFGLDPHEVNLRKSYFIDSFANSLPILTNKVSNLMFWGLRLRSSYFLFDLNHYDVINMLIISEITLKSMVLLGKHI